MLRNKKGQYRKSQWQRFLLGYTTIVFCSIAASLAGRTATPHIISPLAYAQEVTPTPTPNVMEDQAKWIALYAEKYEKPHIGKSKSLLAYQLACLAHKENGWHANNSCGDNGLACGMYQYHEATWEGFRKDMMRKGLVASMSSRLNDQDAIETTAWALANGHELDWGPILRGGCQ